MAVNAVTQGSGGEEVRALVRLVLGAYPQFGCGRLRVGEFLSAMERIQHPLNEVNGVPLGCPGIGRPGRILLVVLRGVV